MKRPEKIEMQIETREICFIDEEKNQVKIETREICVINGVDYPVIKKFTVVHPGWELDDVGYIVNINEQNRLLLSDHGEFSLVDNKPRKDTRLRTFCPELFDKNDKTIPNDQYRLLIEIGKLQEYIIETQEALKLLGFNEESDSNDFLTTKITEK
jgi:hypothetical protein